MAAANLSFGSEVMELLMKGGARGEKILLLGSAAQAARKRQPIRCSQSSQRLVRNMLMIQRTRALDDLTWRGMELVVHISTDDKGSGMDG